MVNRSAANIHEQQARSAKVTQLVATARARKITAEQVAWDASIRSMLVTVTGVNAPSMWTWRLVVQTLESLEKMDAQPVDDLFDAFAESKSPEDWTR